jgi:EAL domain-containing protein (putative c-di-GMP-specific phosphodiesterase class I)
MDDVMPRLQTFRHRVVQEGHESRAVWFHPAVDLVDGTLRYLEGRPVGGARTASRPSGASGEEALRSACELLALRGRDGRRAGVLVGVGVVPSWLHDGQLAVRVAAALASANVRPHRLVLEIAEHTLATMPSPASQVRAVRRLGVRVFLANFGAGGAPLGRLAVPQLDGIKLSRSLTTGVAKSRARGRLVAAVLDYAREFGLFSVAEDVDGEPTKAALAELGCHCGQGVALAPPLSEAAAADLPGGTFS